MVEDRGHAFGDSTLAERRLGLLAHCFEPTSDLFVRIAAPETVNHVIDLGCGPGHTTRMLAAAFPSATVIGLDNSEQFIRAARANEHYRARFYLHDVTGEPPPGPPADLIYARYLLTHISDAAGAISRWMGLLSTGGRLLIEENLGIDTHNPVFAEYLAILTQMLTGRANNLYLEQKLSEFAVSESLNCAFDKVTPVHVADRAAAGMFRLNVETWQDDPFILENYSQRVVSTMMAALDEIIDVGRQFSSITFNVRQLAFERR